ncbi:glutaminyl-peptide cyclotransferase [Chryseobacterium sp. 09-1422]|uniref:Glutaminyl-peptide cyclotransferase n=1 Tax=Chryseobacterium kimseyorum TaxID=2984028 RepID=A0ABT3I0J5_9FLAO|nr:glutaminyl-peptide cyclotransferase [Chryseobacterium kimseyorum]MCW3169556.1 glutaminyl-peptide cyclotransferase [Chryseobacterium kimseyorum]
MKKLFMISFVSILSLISCNKEQKILSALEEYNVAAEQKAFHFGDKLDLPKDVLENAESISISFGDKQTDNLTVDPRYFTFGENRITLEVKTKDGETLNQDATINVFTRNPEKNISYDIVAEYPHDANNFVEGFLMDGDMIYESDGLDGSSQLIKYKLGQTLPAMIEKQPAGIFSEGCAIVGDKIFQLTYKNRLGFIYDKNTFKKISEFLIPNLMVEGWGLTFDGRNLVATDGSNKLYYLDINDASQIVKILSVGGSHDIFNQLNELEFHQGFIYSNIWHQPIILKINPANGEVVGKFDFSKIAKPFLDADTENVLNGIAFKGNNMLVTGKKWSKIYEIAAK